VAVYFQINKETTEYKQQVTEKNTKEQYESKHLKYLKKANGMNYLNKFHYIRTEHKMCLSMNGNDSPECYCKKETDILEIKKSMIGIKNAPTFESIIKELPKEFTQKNNRINCKFIN
jgi:hypothetical protein